jgi:hypothetical protein
VIMDEMDLVREALDVTPWSPEAYERARTALRATMAEAGPRPLAAPVPAAVPLRGRGSSGTRNRRRGTLGARGKAGIGAGIAAVAAAAAVLLATTSAPPPAAPAAVPASAASAASPGSKAPVVTSKLVTLAAFIKANEGSLPGNASLVISRQVNGGKLMQVVYALYADNGDLYLGDDKKTLMAEVAGHENQADGTNAREIAAARYTAAGDLATAVKRMVGALPNDFFDSLAAYRQGPAARYRQHPLDCLHYRAVLGGGNPEIRAGVLRLISTIPQATVKDSTTGGQRTLTITAGSALFGGGSDQVLTVNARTGMPVSSVESGGGLPTAVETDQVSRVTLAGIKAGKF